MFLYGAVLKIKLPSRDLAPLPHQLFGRTCTPPSMRGTSSVFVFAPWSTTTVVGKLLPPGDGVRRGQVRVWSGGRCYAKINKYPRPR